MPPLIVTPQDAGVPTAGVLSVVEMHEPHVDGIVIGSFGDTGIDAVRQRTGKPAVGMARSAYAAAEVAMSEKN